MWTAQHPALLGCHVVREDPFEAVGALAAAREQWIERARAQRRGVPDPSSEPRYTLVLSPDHTGTEAQRAKAALHQTAAENIPTEWLPA
ncbi:MAG: hypothetical protein HYW06_07850 [Gemmatimonadetes bacterium]|nr:hypothetical protein [Gemmatimonadota bacterium]MBI2536860.1 hypothetical protein [Gemmatimonadota bacterium]